MYPKPSPIQYFLADIVSCFSKEECTPLKFDNSRTIGSLIWADDLVILSETEKGLQNMLKNLSFYANENRMKINFDKTKCMIFNKTGKFMRRNFEMGQEIIHSTNFYKYLGFVMTPSGEINTGLKDLKDRALRAYYSLKGKMGRHFMLCPNTTLHLFDSLVKPILLYNSDFWGCLKLPENNPIANVHMRFCKELLGVQRQTTNIGVLLELGRIPILLYGVKNCIKNWSRIEITKKANEIVLKAHEISLINSLKWTEAVKSHLNKSGIGSGNRCSCIHSKAFGRMSDIFHQEAFEKINNDESKLRTFGKLKTSIGISEYLTEVKHIDSRVALSKIRLSNHDLMIEKGRHMKIDKTERFCPFCQTQVETELHFILQCKTFQVFRRTLMSEIKNFVPLLDQSLEQDKLVTLLTNKDIASKVGNFLHNSLSCRRFLLSKPKTLI